ncbi:hypothetical protein SEUCBS139899_000375 [Sporothrix eucalyptigena]|uniref:Myb-like DNA-binding domain-containing protein n=1 Tax=Sporothrix eucalyptigena TaxID=1812306 RepID=A0ABP0BDD8_9PEZI
MSATEQVSFLLACIKHTATGGKIDFATVATELKIPTKAAAAKRFERLKKRARSTDFGACTAAVSGAESDGDNAPATSKPQRTPAKPRAKEKLTATATTASAEVGSGEVSASPVDTKATTKPSSNKRKRTAAPSNSDTGDSASSDHKDDSNEDPAYTGNQSVTANHTSTRVPTPKRAKAMKAAEGIKLEAKAEAAELDEETASIGKIESSLVIDITVGEFDDGDMSDDAI